MAASDGKMFKYLIKLCCYNYYSHYLLKICYTNLNSELQFCFNKIIGLKTIRGIILYLWESKTCIEFIKSATDQILRFKLKNRCMQGLQGNK